MRSSRGFSILMKKMRGRKRNRPNRLIIIRSLGNGKTRILSGLLMELEQEKLSKMKSWKLRRKCPRRREREEGRRRLFNKMIKKQQQRRKVLKKQIKRMLVRGMTNRNLKKSKIWKKKLKKRMTKEKSHQALKRKRKLRKVKTSRKPRRKSLKGDIRITKKIIKKTPRVKKEGIIMTIIREGIIGMMID